MNFIITDLFIDSHRYGIGYEPTLMYQGHDWKKFEFNFPWVEYSDDNPIEYHIQIITHRGNMFETIAIPNEDHYWVPPES